MLSSRVTAVCLFVLLSLISYANSYENEFVGDDIGYITYNQKNLEQGTYSAAVARRPDRPFLMTSIWLNYAIGGTSPVNYRILNAILHGLVGFLLFSFGLLFMESRVLAGLAAAVFIVHPLNNLAVISIIQRGVILSAIFSLLSLLVLSAWSKTSKRSYYLLSLLLFVAALASKPNNLLLPFIGAIYLRNFAGKTWRESFKAVSPFFTLLLIPAVIHFFYSEGHQTTALSPLAYLSVETRVMFLYFKQWLWPSHLRFLYEINKDPSILKNLTWLAIAGNLLWIGGLFWLWKAKRLAPAFLLTCFAISMIPESTLFSINHVAFEYRTYLPFGFLAMGLAALLPDVPATRAIAGAAVIALVPVNWMRNSQISSEEKWVFDTFQYTKGDDNFNVFYLDEFLTTGKLDSGLKMATELAALFPQERTYDFYARIYKFQKGELTEPLPHLLNEMQAYLTDPKGRIHWMARFGFDRFYFQHVKDAYPEADSAEKIDDLVFPQIQNFHLTEDKFGSLLENYRKRLVIISQRFAQLKDPDQAQVLRGLRAMIVIDHYYSGNLKSVINRQFDAWTSRHPDWAQLRQLKDWYASLG